MSLEGEYQERYRGAHERLMGFLPPMSRKPVVVRPPQPAPKVPKSVAKFGPWFMPEAVFYDNCEINRPRPRTARQIIEEVCAKHGVSWNEISSHRRFVPIVRARQEAFWRLHKETNMSLPQMARRLGGFDHTTCLHAIRQHQKRLDDGVENPMDSPELLLPSAKG